MNSPPPKVLGVMWLPHLFSKNLPPPPRLPGFPHFGVSVTPSPRPHPFACCTRIHERWSPPRRVSAPFGVLISTSLPFLCTVQPFVVGLSKRAVMPPAGLSKERTRECLLSSKTNEPNPHLTSGIGAVAHGWCGRGSPSRVSASVLVSVLCCDYVYRSVNINPSQNFGVCRVRFWPRQNDLPRSARSRFTRMRSQNVCLCPLQ